MAHNLTPGVFDPVLEWCISNVLGHCDARSNVYPRKLRPEQKIDAAVALIMAMARCMAAKPLPSIYESCGIFFTGWEQSDEAMTQRCWKHRAHGV
jgi:hypothetical protein